MARISVIGTCDTKLEELLFLCDQIVQYHPQVNVFLIDAGRTPVTHDRIAITQNELIAKYGDGNSVSDLPRGEMIKFMTSCATKAVQELFNTGSIDGIIAAGGSGGTSLASAVMREALPIGFPKFIVSTVASGETGPIVGETDIALMYSVVDVAGLNQTLREILSNAGAAIGAAALSYAARKTQAPDTTKKRVGITMFGVTTPGVDAIRRHLESQYPVEVYVFHATGHGGKAMERLVREGRLDAVLDLTTTEICDLLTGGFMSAGPDRLEAPAEAGIPYVLSLGATDMTNFGPKSTVPQQYAERLLYEHNPVVTLMRTSPEESQRIGEFIVSKLSKHVRTSELVQVWIPRGGVSMIAVPDGPFYDPQADERLFAAVIDGLEGTSIEVVDDPRDINDEGFARDIAEALATKMGLA